MMKPQPVEVGRDWGLEYDLRKSVHADLLREVEFALERTITPDRLKTHNVVTRLKTRDSFLEKITRKQYTDPLEQMHDIVAARIICLFVDDLRAVDALIQSAFDVITAEDKTATTPPELLRYRSVHYECRLRDTYAGPRYDEIKNLVFEIQCRTILQDAWAAVEHHLAYKGTASIPAELRRDFSALVGLFHVADKTFQQLYYDSTKAEATAKEAVQEQAATIMVHGSLSASTDIVIDRGSVKALLRELYPNRQESDSEAYSALAEELAASKIRGIGQLRKILQDADDAGRKSELRQPPNGKQGEKYWDVGIARITLDEVVPSFEERRNKRRESKRPDDQN